MYPSALSSALRSFAFFLSVLSFFLPFVGYKQWRHNAAMKSDDSSAGNAPTQLLLQLNGCLCLLNGCSTATHADPSEMALQSGRRLSNGFPLSCSSAEQLMRSPLSREHSLRLRKHFHGS